MANITVCAIGLNILPSMPTKAKIGMYTIKMMISPKAAELLIFIAAIFTCSFICAAVNFLPAKPVCKRCTMASVIITAPSTIRPKSMAPKLIRLAEIPNTFIIEIANSIANGMTEATIRPARQLPSISTRIKTTIRPPSNRLVLTVPIAVATNLSRTKYGSMTTPSGSDFLICLTRSFTLSVTASELAPLSIITRPPTASSPSLTKAP